MRGNQERLHDHHASDAERDRLGHEAEPLRGEPEQPDGLPSQSGQETRPDRLGRLLGGGLLLQHEPEREEERSDERESDVHAMTLELSDRYQARATRLVHGDAELHVFNQG